MGVKRAGKLVAIDLRAMQFYRFLLVLPIAALCSCRHAKPVPGFGDQWRAMSRLERQSYVSAFIDGDNTGTFNLCKALNDKIVVLKLKGGVDVTDDPCRQFAPTFTHGDTKAAGTLNYVDPYVEVIDEFYTHPECRVMPFTVILEHLDDAEFKSGEALYRSVRQGTEHWGFFSGFDGIEQCYGVDRKQ